MIFALLTLLSALSLAAVAGWFSIVGFMTIYAGAPLYALVMGIVTECAKLITASWLYRNWEFSDWKLKVPLVYFTVCLMVITSTGVFGFLSKAHIEQNSGTLNNSAKVEELSYKIDREKAVVADNEKVIAQLDATVNSLLSKENPERALSVRRSQTSQRKQLQDVIASAQAKIDTLSAEKFKLESEIRALQLEVGPIRYIAEMIYGTDDTSKNIESAVKIFTLLIVSTLDPLAIILLIAANNTLMRLRREEVDHPAEPPENSPENQPTGVVPSPQADTIAPVKVNAFKDLVQTRAKPEIPPAPSKTTNGDEQHYANAIDENKPWAKQPAVLRELLGEGLHFSPKKAKKTKVDRVQSHIVDRQPRVGNWIGSFKDKTNE